MPPEDAVKLSEFIDQQMEHRGFAPNVSLSGAKERPFPDLPEGVMVRALRDEKTGEITGYGKLTEAESMSFANALHGYVRRELGGKVEYMLRYVDKNFSAIENSIARSKEDPIPEPIPIWKAGEAHKKVPVEQKSSKCGKRGVASIRCIWCRTPPAWRQPPLSTSPALKPCMRTTSCSGALSPDKS